MPGEMIMVLGKLKLTNHNQFFWGWFFDARGKWAMRIGKIVNLPRGTGEYARVRDENGTDYSVHASEIPDDAKEGDDLAYQVDIWSNPSGPVATLRGYSRNLK